MDRRTDQTGNYKSTPNFSFDTQVLIICMASLLACLDVFGASEGTVLHRSHICYSNPSAVATLNATACTLFIAYSSRVCLWPAVRAACPL